MLLETVRIGGQKAPFFAHFLLAFGTEVFVNVVWVCANWIMWVLGKGIPPG